MTGKINGAVFDVHLNFGSGLYGDALMKSDLAALLKEDGPRYAVLCPVKPPGYHLAAANRAIMDAVSLYPDRLRGFCRVDPWKGRAAGREIRRCARDCGFRGVWLHPAEENFAANEAVVDVVMETAGELNLVVMIAGGIGRYSHPSQLYDLARRYPDVTMIITSGGQINISGALLGEAEKLFVENDNLYLETSGIYRIDFIEEMVRKIGASRILFGSNSPWYSLPLELKRIAVLDVSGEDREKIMVLNSLGLIG